MKKVMNPESYKMNVEQFYWKLKGHVTGRRKMENVVKQLKQVKSTQCNL